MIIRKISRASIAFLCTGFILIMSACSSFEKQPFYELSTQYNYSINRDFWGVPYIKGETDQDVAYGIGLVHAEDAYDDLSKILGGDGIKRLTGDTQQLLVLVIVEFTNNIGKSFS